MPDRDPRTAETPPSEPVPGLVDPRAHPPGPEETGTVTGESPDRDPAAWEGPDPAEGAPGLVDPRPGIPRPSGL